MQEPDELLLINLLSAVLVGTIFGFPSSPLRIALGLPFVLFFPGYTMTAVLYPRRGDLDGAERLALSVGLSLAIVPLIGLMLNYLPWGIRVKPILISLSIFVLLCSLLATWARRHLPREERFYLDAIRLIVSTRRLSRSQIVASLLLTVCIVFVGWRLHTANPRAAETFTEFYILGTRDKTHAYPDRLVVGDSTEVILNIVNHELRQNTYNVVVKESGQVLASLGPIILDDGRKWQRSVGFSPTKPRNRVKIEFLLFREGDSAPYRQLHLWMVVLPR